MKKATEPVETTNRSTLQQMLDRPWQNEIRQLSRYLMPEWFAGYTGFKKLIEKDYRETEDIQSLLNTALSS